MITTIPRAITPAVFGDADDRLARQLALDRERQMPPWSMSAAAVA